MALVHFKGKTYPHVEKPTMGEMAFIERCVGINVKHMVGMEQTLAGLFVTIRRGQLAAGLAEGEHLLTWDELAACTMDDWSMTEDAPPMVDAVPPEPELPEDQWPLDPKDGAIPTDPPSGYDQSGPAQGNVWMTDYGPTTGNLPTGTTGPLTR